MFIHLHNHSHYSLLDGLAKPIDLVNKAKEFGMTSVALTDHGVTHGLIEFYKACKKAEIKPILGVEAYVAPRTHLDKESGIDSKAYHLVLLAKNNEGYKNLLRLTSIANIDGFYYKPRIDKDLLKKYSSGLIGLSACLNGEIARSIMSGNIETAERVLNEYQEIFGKEDFYLEVQPQTSTENNQQELVNIGLLELAKKTGTSVVATKDVHYVNKDDKEAQDALLCIQMGTTITNTERMSMMGIDCHFASEEEMREAFPDNPEVIEETVKIAEKCNVELDLDKNILPSYKTPDGTSDSVYLRKLCEEGIQRRYKEVTKEVKDRLEWELETINKMGFASYFLIVQDFVNYAKSEGIVVGPGRGSAAGSIVAYSLNITDLDPIHYKLLFERFLNPDRISMPDIDMDFADIKRHKVIEYVTAKYGEDHVAGIITFGTMAARAAVRDVGRVLGMPYGDVDHIAKLIPPPVQGRHIPLADSIQTEESLVDLYKKDPQVRRLMDLAIKLEGTVRHASQHACAIVIGDSPLTEYTALQKAQGGDVATVTQYAMGPIENIGLLKMDFLGLSNLSIIQDTIEIVEAVDGQKINIDKIPLDDKKTFELLARGETTGVFQLESSGMKRYIKELKPTDIEDIIAMVSLYRPGPMQFIDSFIKRKHGKEAITYLHPRVENALRNTYGIPVYQEQVMQIAKDMAGFTGGEADTLRKAMGKKIAELMAKMKAKFIAGSGNAGIPKQIASDVFQKLEDFAAYGFNRSHAACYAMISYRTAYLKANWPKPFMAALLNSDSGNMDRITIEVDECKQIGLEVMPPDINESFPRFAVVPNTNKIRFGLLAIKNLGSDIAEAIIAERKKNGKYKSLEELLERVNHKNLNKKSLEALIKCGAMDVFGERGQMLANIQKILDFNRDIKIIKQGSDNSLFGGSEVSLSRPTLQLDMADEADEKQRLAWEKELLGLYISAHPFKEWEPYLKDFITPSYELVDKRDDAWVNVAGTVSALKKIRTKKGDEMAFVTLEDGKSSFEVLVFPKIWAVNRDLWSTDGVIVVGGKMSRKDGEVKILVDKAEILSLDNLEKIKKEFKPDPGSEKRDWWKNKNKTETSAPPRDVINAKDFFNGNLLIQDDGVYITVPKKMKQEQVDIMKGILEKHRGVTPVFLQISGEDKIIKTSYSVNVERFS